jgi:hypothetical protein
MRAVILAVALTLLAGCYKTVYHFDAPAARPSAAYDGRWRTSLFAGIVEVASPVALDGACPGAQVALIEEEGTVLNVLAAGLINLIVAELPLVHFRSVTVHCSPPVGVPTPLAPRP